MFNKDNQLIADYKGDIIDPVHEKYVLQGVDGNWYIRGEVYTFQGRVEFSQFIRIAKEKGENTGFIFGIWAHA